MRYFKFNTNNTVYYDDLDDNGEQVVNMSKSSHLLGYKKKMGLNYFITFDSESLTFFFINNKEVTREEYSNLKYDTNKYFKFDIKVISACYCTGKRYNNILYIQGDSQFKEHVLKFRVNKLRKHASVIYSDNIINNFITDVISFASSKPRTLKKDGTHSKLTIPIYCHNAKHDWLQIGLYNFNKIYNMGFQMWRFTTPRFCNVNLGDNLILSFQDTTNFFKMSLDKVGKSIGIEKLKDTVDFTKDIVIDKTFLTYAMIDSIILVEKMIRFSDLVKEHGKIKYGVPSTAYNIWMTSFMQEKIWLHKNKCLMTLERMSFFGGRTEALKLGYYENIYGIDSNSMYPDKMQQPLPCSYMKSIRDEKGIPHKKYFNLQKSYCLLVECSITANLKLPIIPHHSNGKLLFVNGSNMKKVLCQPEVNKLIEMGAEVFITGLHLYKKGYPMKEFSNFFMEMKVRGKQENDSSLAEFGKLNANACYGKTVEKMIESIEFECDPNIIACKFEEYKGEQYYFSYLAGKKVSNKKINYDSKDAYAILGSFITSYARTDLYTQMVKVGETLGYDRLIYCDTDSIYFNATLEELRSLPIKFHKSKIGAWDIEENNINMVVYGVKDYIKLSEHNFKIKQKIKGVPLHDKSLEQIDDNTFYYESWQGLSYGMKIKDMSHQYVTPVIKTLSREYTKAKVISKDNIKSISIRGTQDYNKDNEIYFNLFKEPQKIEFVQSELEHFTINNKCEYDISTYEFVPSNNIKVARNKVANNKVANNKNKRKRITDIC